jgi:hypothetical protein
MKNCVIILLLFATPLVANAQKKYKRKKSKVSYAQGTLFGYWGYNRSGYTKSNLRFVGPGYDFTLQGAIANDNPEKFNASVYFNPNKITIPQFNARIGYYFKDHWAISLGYDHMKYILADNNQVNLSGTIDASVGAQWEGTYSAEPITTNKKLFHYENSDGLNYLRFELTRTDMLFNVGGNEWFAVSSNLGVGTGGLLSFNDFKFAGEEDIRTVSLSGYALSAHVGVRLEFFRHFFIQPTFSGGMNHQVKVRTRLNDPSSYARHAYGYIMFDTAIGFLLYVRPTNACDSCPVW